MKNYDPLFISFSVLCVASRKLPILVYKPKWSSDQTRAKFRLEKTSKYENDVSCLPDPIFAFVLLKEQKNKKKQRDINTSLKAVNISKKTKVAVLSLNALRVHKFGYFPSLFLVRLYSRKFNFIENIMPITNG